MYSNGMPLRKRERRIAVVVSVLVTTLSVAIMDTLSADDAWPHEAEIVEVIQYQAEAWNRGDLEGFMDGYLKGPALVFTSGGQVRRGWQITYDKYKERYGTSPETMGTLSFSNLEVHPLGDRSAWVLGRWDLSGPSGEAGGIFTLVMQKTDRNWVVVHDHTSSDPVG